jgi:transcriptional regulator with XRE-family HTH domain
MKLNAYLEKWGNASEFARALGVSHTAVYRWRNGKAIPRKALLLRIFAVTRGKVRSADFYDERAR